ncbi:MAG: type I restriction enzyme S subunit [Vicingaceae bacterium]|jgi:type I restriction enzyme S subunit
MVCFFEDGKQISRRYYKRNFEIDMKQGWEIKKLEELFDVQSSKRVHKKDWQSEGVPFYRAREVVKLAKNGFVENELFISEELFNEFTKDKGAPKEDDIIISAVGTLGQCYLVRKQDKFYIKDASVLWLSKKSEISSRYIEYSFKAPSIQEQVLDRSMGATVGTLTISRAKNLEIPLPSLPEQQRIVSILDSAFAAIDKAKANAEQNLQNAKELFESYLQGVFKKKVKGNKHDSLNDLCELIVDCEHKTAPTQETGYPSIRTPNIGKGDLILENVNRVSHDTYIKWTRRAIPKSGDLILAREAPAGNIAVVPDNVEVCLGQRTVLIRPKKDKLIPNYLAYLILSKDVQKILLDHSTGATVQHINMKDIRAFKIYDLSDLDEQNFIVNQLDNLRVETLKLEAVYQKKMDDLEELKKSILQKAFAGELETKKALVV